MSTDGFRVGDVYISGGWRWRVDQVFHDGSAVLRSCTTEWMTTRPITPEENRRDGFVPEAPSCDA